MNRLSAILNSALSFVWNLSIKLSGVGASTFNGQEAVRQIEAALSATPEGTT